MAAGAPPMVAGVPGGKMTSKVIPLELNGTPGYSVDYQFTVQMFTLD